MHIIKSNEIHFRDKSGQQLAINDVVLVPHPNETDIHNHEFMGTVIDIKPNGLCVVEDGENDCFDIEAERLEIINE